MKKAIFCGILVLIFVGIGVLAYFRYQEMKQKEKKPRANPVEQSVVVNMVMPGSVTMFDERVFSGSTKAWSSVDIDPKVSGKLITLNFNIGDAIKKGDLIAKIDDVEYVQKVRQAEANLETARAKLAEAKELLSLRSSEFDRQSKLHATKVTSESNYEAALSSYNVQKANTAMCEADVKACEAQLSTAQIHLSDTTITADWKTGSDVRYVGDRYVDEGTLVSTGKSLLNIIEIDRIKAHIQVIERDYRFLKEGQKVEISTDAYPGEVFEGVISNVSNILSENTRNALVVISIDNHDYRLRPGMFVRARVVFSEHKNAQVVPPNAILTYEKTQGVFCYDKSTESAKFFPVKIGLSNRTQVEILSPKLDMPVVTVGNHLLQNGRKITVSQLSRKQIVESMRETKPDDSKNAEKK